MKFLIVAMALAVLALVTPAVSSATPTLVIHFTGLDLKFAGGLLCDATSCDGNDGIRAESDPLTSMAFGIDNDGDAIVDAPVGLLTTNIWADVRLGLTDIPAGGGIVVQSNDTSDNWIFDLLTKDTDPGWGLALDVTEWTALYSNGTLNFFGGGTASNIFSQDLPFGLVVDMPVTFSFSSKIANVTDDGTNVTGFTASGTGEIQAPIPEPGTMLLLGSGLTGLAVRRRRNNT